jgi:hypothetical protein
MEPCLHVQVQATEEAVEPEDEDVILNTPIGFTTFSSRG